MSSFVVELDLERGYYNMYEKNLTEDLRLRLSTTDMDFLRSLSKERAVSVSYSAQCVSVYGLCRHLHLYGIYTYSS